MNGKASRLLRKMKSATKQYKRSWRLLTDDQKHAIRVLIRDNPNMVDTDFDLAKEAIK